MSSKSSSSGHSARSSWSRFGSRSGLGDHRRRHQISLRYLHRVCQQQATTPMAFIRQQRLDRCRRDLANAALSHLTIHAVATRWGYPQPDRFSRAFRTAVGMSPSEYRVAMRTAPAPGEAAGEAAGAG
ncbi:helix-turn-helix transcriptional regulator [Streptomyces sp. NPDC002172]